MSFSITTEDHFDKDVLESDCPTLLYWGAAEADRPDFLVDLANAFGGLIKCVALQAGKEEGLRYQYDLEDAGLILFNDGQEISRGGREALADPAGWVSAGIDLMLNPDARPAATSSTARQTKSGKRRNQSGEEAPSPEKPFTLPEPERVPALPLSQEDFYSRVVNHPDCCLVVFASKKTCLSKSARERIPAQLGRMREKIDLFWVMKEEAPELVKTYKLKTFPSMYLFKKGHMINADIGTQPIWMVRWLARSLSLAQDLIDKDELAPGAGLSPKQVRNRFARLRKAQKLGHV